MTEVTIGLGIALSLILSESLGVTAGGVIAGFAHLKRLSGQNSLANRGNSSKFRRPTPNRKW